MIGLIFILHDNDFFIQAYATHLVDRLISKAYNSKNAELLMIEKMKQEIHQN